MKQNCFQTGLCPGSPDMPPTRDVVRARRREPHRPQNHFQIVMEPRAMVLRRAVETAQPAPRAMEPRPEVRTAMQPALRGAPPSPPGQLEHWAAAPVDQVMQERLQPVPASIEVPLAAHCIQALHSHAEWRVSCPAT
jgi:hypothetical protein